MSHPTSGTRPGPRPGWPLLRCLHRSSGWPQTLSARHIRNSSGTSTQSLLKGRSMCSAQRCDGHALQCQRYSVAVPTGSAAAPPAAPLNAVTCATSTTEIVAPVSRMRRGCTGRLSSRAVLLSQAYCTAARAVFIWLSLLARLPCPLTQRFLSLASIACSSLQDPGRLGVLHLRHHVPGRPGPELQCVCRTLQHCRFTQRWRGRLHSHCQHRRWQLFCLRVQRRTFPRPFHGQETRWHRALQHPGWRP